MKQAEGFRGGRARRCPRSWAASEMVRIGRFVSVFAVSLSMLLTTLPAASVADDSTPAPASLESQLVAVPAETLAEEAEERGDARRGAILFHRRSLQCAKCHRIGETEQNGSLGPDLATWEVSPEIRHLVESILKPSAMIREGFEPWTIATKDGQIVTGLLAAETPEGIALRRVDRDGEVVTIARGRIEERARGETSVMPAGLVNALGTRQEFLDLVKYLAEIARGGPKRARELEPPAWAVAEAPLPAYESEIDHAGLIRDLDDESFKRGRAIFERLCINCHGTAERPGSLPTSRRFAAEPLKNGADPYSLYRTLTHGFGQMDPQTWMVPKQKYDVIHYLREGYFKKFNTTQYVNVTDAYLASLPEGTTRGPEPTSVEPWVTMDYGPFLTAAYEVGDDGSNFAYKGVAVRLDPGPGGVSRGRCWMVFDHDTMRVAAAWSGSGFIDWKSIHFDGTHAVHPRVVGDIHLANPTGPGWADPESDGFDDTRIVGRDGRHYGPLPRSWARYRGLRRYGDRVVFSYTIGEATVEESPGLARLEPGPVFTRSFAIGPRERDLVLQVARRPNGGRRPLDLPGAVAIGDVSGREGWMVAGLAGDVAGASWETTGEGDLRLRLPAGARLRFTLWFAEVEDEEAARELAGSRPVKGPPADFEEWARIAEPLWPVALRTEAKIGAGDGTFAVDTLTAPQDNPWMCRVRPAGFDFLPGGDRAAVCTWDGDVWIVGGVDRPEGGLTWKRYASGLFQPLGLKVIEGQITVTCRDQIVILRDRNGDGEADFYDCFNNDQQVTDHFHEFAMGLQTDDAGNLYYARAACHGLKAIVPQHGTLLRVSQDGLRTEILATGFRAPNGVCLNPDGTFFLTDQEGFWTPKNRINWVRPGRFYGNMWGYTDVTDPSDDAMEPPVCWITNRFDRSPSELLWVLADTWGPLGGALLNFSYGYGKIFVVLHETIGDQKQGGMVELPIPPFPTGIIRGRFHPGSRHLYVCGLYAWAGAQTYPGDFYRVRYQGGPVHVPIGLHAGREGLRIDFTEPLDRETAGDVKRYKITVWSLKRTESYGSEHFDEQALDVTSARVSDDGRSVTLAIRGLGPTRGMEVRYDLRAADGRPVAGAIHNTIHQLIEN